jgi:phage-related tail protein
MNATHTSHHITERNITENTMQKNIVTDLTEDICEENENICVWINMTTTHKINMRPNIKETNKLKPFYIQGIKNLATRFKEQTHNKKPNKQKTNDNTHTENKQHNRQNKHKTGLQYTEHTQHTK